MPDVPTPFGREDGPVAESPPQFGPPADGGPARSGPYAPPPYSPLPYPPPPHRTPLQRRGWFIVLVAIVVVGVVGGVAGTALKGVLPTMTAQAPLTGLEDIGQAPGLDPTALAEAVAIGVPVRDENLEFTVSGIECGVPQVGTDVFGEQAQGEFCIVTVDAVNVGTEPATLFGSDQVVYDDAGQVFEPSPTAGLYLDAANSYFASINPGNSVTVALVYDVPVGTEPAVIELHGTPFSQAPGVLVALR